MILMGATRESAMVTISDFAQRLQDEYIFIGEYSESVMEIRHAFFSLPYSIALRVLMEYLGKLMPMSTSSELSQKSCS